MILHVLVYVEVRAGRRVEAGEKLVNHDEKFHLLRFFHELSLGLLLEVLDLLLD